MKRFLKITVTLITVSVILAGNSPRHDQKSLLIIFDATASMGDDLAQLRAAALDIINDFSSRADNPIYNYVLVVFRDPGKNFFDIFV
jgi:hypothetical protein